ATYTVPASYREGSTFDTHAPGTNPGMRVASVLSHVLPPSRDTLTVPSSVPAEYSPACFGDSAKLTIVGQALMPSSLAMRISLPFTPVVTICSRSASVVRSGLTAVHESPRSVERNTWLPAMYSTPASFGENTIGVSQLNRYP